MNRPSRPDDRRLDPHGRAFRRRRAMRRRGSRCRPSSRSDRAAARRAARRFAPSGARGSASKGDARLRAPCRATAPPATSARVRKERSLGSHQVANVRDRNGRRQAGASSSANVPGTSCSNGRCRPPAAVGEGRPDARRPLPGRRGDPRRRSRFAPAGAPAPRRARRRAGRRPAAAARWAGRPSRRRRAAPRSGA